MTWWIVWYCVSRRCDKRPYCQGIVHNVRFGCLPTASSAIQMSMWFNPFRKKPWFSRVCSTSLLKRLWEKEKLLVMSNFSISHGVFHPFWELSAIFIEFKIVVCEVSSLNLEESKICLGKGYTISHAPTWTNVSVMLICQPALFLNRRVFSLTIIAKILDPTKLESFADENINVHQMIEFIFDSVENIVRKKEEMLLTAFSPFSTMFSKDSLLRVGIVWQKFKSSPTDKNLKFIPDN